VVIDISEADEPFREAVAKSERENHPETRGSALPRLAARNHAGDPGGRCLAVSHSDHIAATSKGPLMA
jgi:hypothetical protein